MGFSKAAHYIRALRSAGLVHVTQDRIRDARVISPRASFTVDATTAEDARDLPRDAAVALRCSETWKCIRGRRSRLCLPPRRRYPRGMPSVQHSDYSGARIG